MSDEFDQYMERASLEALMALAMLCKEAREVRHTTLRATTLQRTLRQRCLLALLP